MRWLAPRPYDWVAAFLYVAAIFVTALPFVAKAPPTALDLARLAAMAGGLTLLAAVDRWEWRRFGEGAPPRAAAWALLAIRVVLIETVIQISGFGVSIFLYLLLPFTAGLALGPRVSGVVGGLALTSFFVKLTLAKPDWWTSGVDLQNAVIFTLSVLFVIAIVQLMLRDRAGRRHSERLLAELETSHARLAAYAAQAEQAAATQERNRIAREIHDGLGHALTTLNVQLEKALAYRPHDSAVADQAVVQSKALAHAALNDVRRSVGMLRESREPLVLSHALRDLIAPLQGEQLRVALDVHGSQAGFDPAVLTALFRAAQEALTNAQRHSAAAHVRIDLDFTDEHALLTVHDDGRGFDVRATEAQTDRFGLRGLRERLALIGGTLDIVSAPGLGTTLRFAVPRQTAR